MKVKRNGVVRLVTEADYLHKFKGLGFEIVEEKPKEKTVDDYTKAEIMEMLDEQEKEYSPQQRKAELYALLKE